MKNSSHFSHNNFFFCYIQAALAEAEALLAAQMEVLTQKRAQLQTVMDKLQALNDEFAEFSKKKKELEDQIDICEKKLDRFLNY